MVAKKTIYPTGKEFLIISTQAEDLLRMSMKHKDKSPILPKVFSFGLLRPEHADIIAAEWVYLKFRPIEERESILKQVR